ncbi:MAG: helix-turn-helix domain-containing protein [Candidatus Omnitrophica bacterium]|nr:helix-turn-helix domain-containing protein [Candidatus Omnitrophota bacterium]
MSASQNNLITVDELSKIYEMSKATINYYTNMGLLHIADKKGNKRLYDKLEVEERLKKIKDLRMSGYNLRLIRKQFTK